MKNFEFKKYEKKDPDGQFNIDFKTEEDIASDNKLPNLSDIKEEVIVDNPSLFEKKEDIYSEAEEDSLNENTEDLYGRYAKIAQDKKNKRIEDNKNKKNKPKDPLSEIFRRDKLR